MENIDISRWVRSALVVDDKWGEVKNLIQILNSNGVSTSYYNPNPENDYLKDELFDTSEVDELDGTVKEVAQQAIDSAYEQILDALAYTRMESLGEGSLTGYDLIFLDIDFGFDHLRDVKLQVNYAIQRLKDALNEESSPYGLVVWSKESTSPHDGEDGEAESTFAYIKDFLFGDALENKPKPYSLLT